MVRLRIAKMLVFLIVADTVTAFFGKTKLKMNDLESVETRRKGGKYRSTSSGEHDRGKDEDDNSDDKRESLDVSSEGDGSDESKEKNKKYIPKSSRERSGWRKWHRKCPKCPEDEEKKWRDPDIQWICGGYQRARRSFKSTCMMRYRNCQDGTMFVFLHYHRCDNDTGKLTQPFGRHFFYDYEVKLWDEDSDSVHSSDSADATDDDSSSHSSASDKDRRRQAAGAVGAAGAAADTAT